MPVVKAEPPVMAAEVVGSVVERDLLDLLFTGKAQLADLHRAAHVRAAADDRLRRAGGSEAVAALEKADAVLVLDDGKPAGVLTRQDLLGFLAAG